MKKLIGRILCLILAASLLFPPAAYAREGDCGYEGGISSGEAPGRVTYEYQEVCFVTGEPVVFKGTLLIRKSFKQDNISTTYTYNLRNMDKSATLTRVLVYNTKLTKKDNGQTVEETTLSGRPSEVIKINNTTYTLTNYDFTRTNIIDTKPAINYYSGNLWGRKTYQTGTAGNTGTISVETTGSFYGYDQYWGTTEVEILNHIIQGEQKKGQKIDKWGGTARVTLSSTTSKDIKYVENRPDQISFDGGYVLVQHNNSILEYSARLPEFDEKGISTDNMIQSKGSLELESFPIQTRLPVPDINHLRGHWAENDIRALYSLEIFQGDGSTFDPEEFITRAEFTSAIVRAAKEVPPDPALASRLQTMTAAPGRNAKVNIVSPFSDVSTDDRYFSYIDAAYKKGLVIGRGDDAFAPGGYVTVADAAAIFIRALGLEGLAPGGGAVTTFRDNDEIPGYARKAVYVAEKIGLLRGDEKGYLYPNEKLTKARAAALINVFIDYMREGIRKDYRERIVNY